MELYEIVKKLMARGCPDHPRVKARRFSGMCCWQMIPEPDDQRETTCCPSCHEVSCECEPMDIHDDDASDLWTMHALRWAATKHHVCINFFELDGKLCHDVTVDGQYMHAENDPLASIEAATLHLEPTGKPTR